MSAQRACVSSGREFYGRVTMPIKDEITPEQIKSLRKSLSLSTSQTGGLLGVSKRTVEAWECGRFKPNPSALKMLRKLQEEQNVNLRRI